MKSVYKIKQRKMIIVVTTLLFLTALLTGCANQTLSDSLSEDQAFISEDNTDDNRDDIPKESEELYGENSESAEDEPVDDNVIDPIDYSTYLKKIWIKKEWNSEDHGWSDSLVITQMENGHIEGYYGSVKDDYFNLPVNQDGLYPFTGEIFDGIAECEYEYVDGRNKPLTITFYENDCIRVEPDGDAYRNCLFRPYHVSDWQFRGEPTSYEAELDSWGTVTLFYANLEDRHSYPWVLLLDDQGDILYKFPGRFRIDSEVSEVIIEDVNGDGLKDVEVITRMNGTDEDRMEWFFYQMEDGLFFPEKCNGNDSADVPPFLTFDWTDDEVLFHSIRPEDSARGWVFSLADVDFDGRLEVLITFTANHCGGDSLYIYKQDEEKVFSLTDTYATFREDVTWLSKGYGSLSPYLDIDLLDAYVNGEGEYRYLSLDYTLFGGFGELLLYVTTLEEDAPPVKLVEIKFIENESSEEMEIYFQEEKVLEPEELHELLEQYMAGYKKVEMEYKISDSFQRDIVAFNENEKRQCLEDIYESLKEYLDLEQDHLLSLVEPEEKRQTIQGILDKECNQLVRLVVNRLEGLNCCLFETGR